MSNVNNQFKELINEAIHNHFHDKTELEMTLKDWLYGICEQLDEYEAKARAWDRTQELLEECTHQTPGDDYEVDWHEFEIKIDDVISDYESGELE